MQQKYSRDLFANPRHEHELDGVVRVTFHDHFEHGVLDVVGRQMRLELFEAACARRLQA